MAESNLQLTPPAKALIVAECTYLVVMVATITTTLRCHGPPVLMTVLRERMKKHFGFR